VAIGCDSDDREYDRRRAAENRADKAFKALVLREVGKPPTDDHLQSYEQIYKINGTEKVFNYEMEWDDNANEPDTKPLEYVYKTQSVDASFVHYSLKRPTKEGDGMYALTDLFEGDQILVVPYVRISLVRVTPQPLEGASFGIRDKWDIYLIAIKEWRAECAKLEDADDHEDEINEIEGRYRRYSGGIY
tara:strand:- start:10050 stop:10616 length:567 start_codon:yes stop_codon:yes gene_type:complete